MDISFKNKRLEKLANDQRKCEKAFGKNRSKIFLMRLLDLQAASTLEDTRHLPGHYHELKGDRKGEWACDLDQPYRLIFAPQENPIPIDVNGRYIWIEIVGVEIIEIVDYHE